LRTAKADSNKKDDRYSARRNKLVDKLRASGYVVSLEVERAMRTVPRELFVPDRLIGEAYIDSPLPIGKGQTISAPHMVAIMLEEMNLETGMKVLEIGGGSGYHAAVAAEIVKPGGKVFTIERIPELVEFAKSNLMRSGYSQHVEVNLGDGSLGLPDRAPFDRIFVACGAPDVPLPLIEQLSDGGVILVPVGGRHFQDLIKVTKKNDKLLREKRGGCVFVPLIGEHGY